MEEVQRLLDVDGPEKALQVAKEKLQQLPAEDVAGRVAVQVAASQCHLRAAEQQEALKVAQEALELALKGRVRKAEALGLLAVANATVPRDSDDALLAAKRSLSLHQELRDAKGQALALLALAQREPTAEKARSSAKQALERFSAEGDKRSEGDALLVLAGIEMGNPAPQAGARTADTPLNVAKEIGAKKAELSVWNTIVGMYMAKNSPLEVRKTGDNGLDLSKALRLDLDNRLKDSKAFARLRTSVFAPPREPSQLGEAEEFAQRSLSTFKETANKRGQVDALLMLASASLSAGDCEKALQTATQALDIAKGIKDRGGVLAALTEVARVHFNSKPTQPLRMLEAAKDGVVYFKNLGDKRGAAAAAHLVADVQYATHTRRDEPREARRAAAAATAFYRDLGDADGEVAVLNTVMLQSLAREQPDQALKAAEDLLTYYQTVGNKKEEATTLDVVAHLHLMKENTRKALKAAEEALTIVQAMGDVKAELRVMTTVANVQLVRHDGQAAMDTAENILLLNQKLGDERGVADATCMVYKVHALAGAEEEAIRVAHEALGLLRAVDDKVGQLAVLEFLTDTLHEKGQGNEALPLAREALAITRELGLAFAEGTALFMIAKCDISSREGLGCAYEAANVFKRTGDRRAEAVALHAVANACLIQKVGAKEGLAAAFGALELHRLEKDKQGEAIMLHTVANCQLALRETDAALNSAYDALHMFEEVGDGYGKGLALKLLQGAGQGDEEIRERREQHLATKFDSLDTVGPRETEEEKADRDAKAQALQDEQVLWEYTYIPEEWKDPAQFGEKHTGPRHVFAVSQLKDKKLLGKLMSGRPKKLGTPGGGNPCFLNQLNGRFLKTPTLNSGMKAARCGAVIFDMSQLNNVGMLEGIDVALRLIQGLITIDEPRVALDVVTTSCMSLAATAGLQEPFHAGLWGLCRAARQENPQHEFRCLDIDRERRQQDLPLICRYLLGAQQTRPQEAIFRAGGLHVCRMVGSRTPLPFPVKIEVKRQ